MPDSAFNYDRISFYVENYGHPEVDEQRAVENFIICESAEALPALIAQLSSVAKGGSTEEVMDQVAGKRRKVKYGSYENWAKLVLLWINQVKNQA